MTSDMVADMVADMALNDRPPAPWRAAELWWRARRDTTSFEDMVDLRLIEELPNELCWELAQQVHMHLRRDQYPEALECLGMFAGVLIEHGWPEGETLHHLIKVRECLVSGDIRLANAVWWLHPGGLIQPGKYGNDRYGPGPFRGHTEKGAIVLAAYNEAHNHDRGYWPSRLKMDLGVPVRLEPARPYHLEPPKTVSDRVWEFVGGLLGW